MVREAGPFSSEPVGGRGFLTLAEPQWGGVGLGGGGPGQFGGRMDRGTLGGTSLTDPGRESNGQGRHWVAWGPWGLGKDLGVARMVWRES